MQAKHATAKVVVLSFACEAGKLRQRRGLHGLKEHQQDTSDERSCDEQCNAVLLGRRGEQLDAGRTHVRQELCEDRSEQEPAERTRQLGVRRLGPGGEQASLPLEYDGDGDDRGDAKGKAVEADGVDTDDDDAAQNMIRTVPSTLSMKPYAPNLPFPERVPRVVNNTKSKNDREHEADQKTGVAR